MSIFAIISKSLLNSVMYLFFICILLILPSCSDKGSREQADTVTIFAAASTHEAVSELIASFNEMGRECAVASFASSGVLAKQIENGAPANIYISANPMWMDYLEQKGVIDAESRFNLMGNSLVIIGPVHYESSMEISPGFTLVETLEDGMLAMADPDHAPAGAYAKQALEALVVWKDVSDSVARAKDVRAALAFVERGDAPFGIVYRTDALVSGKVKIVGEFPSGLHDEIQYPAAVVSGNESEAAKAFMEFLRSAEADTIFERHGFLRTF